MHLYSYLIHVVSIVGTLNLVVILSESAPTPVKSPLAKPAPAIITTISNPLASSVTNSKLKRDTRAKMATLELDTQETGYMPAAYQATDSDYGYDAGKNTYGKQASDWSLYDQGRYSYISKSSTGQWQRYHYNHQLTRQSVHV